VTVLIGAREPGGADGLHLCGVEVKGVPKPSTPAQERVDAEIRSGVHGTPLPALPLDGSKPELDHGARRMIGRLMTYATQADPCPGE